MSPIEIYSLSETALVLREPVSVVRRLIDQRRIRSHATVNGGRKSRGVDYKTLVFLMWSREHQDEIKPALWQKIYDKLVEHTGLPTFVDTGVFRVSLIEATEQVLVRLATLGEIDGQIEVTKGGDAILKSTDIEVHRIAALIEGGMSRDEVLGDYPSLKAGQVDIAVAYAAAHPKAGRPYPKLSAKAAMRQADLSALDDRDRGERIVERRE